MTDDLEIEMSQRGLLVLVAMFFATIAIIVCFGFNSDSRSLETCGMQCHGHMLSWDKNVCRCDVAALDGGSP